MWTLVVALIPFAVSMTATPGPNNIIAMASGTNFGYWRTLPLILGIVFGVSSMILCLGLGLGQVFTRYPDIHATLKYLASAYLLFLAWKIATARNTADSKTQDRPMTFLQGALFQWINPKAWVMAISAVTSFTSPALSPFAQALVICLVMTSVAIPAVSAWAIFGIGIAQFLKSQQARRIFNIAAGGLLALSLIPVYLQ